MTWPYPVHLNDHTRLGGVVTECGVGNARTVAQCALVERTGPLCIFRSVKHGLDEVLASSTVVKIALGLCGIIVRCIERRSKKN